MKTIISLKNKNSVGYDGISTRILKETAVIVAPVLTYIINTSMEKGIFPDKLKFTIIRPLFKKGDKVDINNYRPVALIPVMSKVFERIIYAKINSFFESNSLFTERQYGFRKNKTINMAVFDFLHRVVKAVDNRETAIGLYMDMSKAFDHVSHKTLIDKLERYGVRGNVKDLITSYLSNRQQVTQINRLCPTTLSETTYTSMWRTVSYGVPQGSVLGPLLFIIYINDLPMITNNYMTLFADDSTILFTNDIPNNIQSTDINNTLTSIINWLEHNNLHINLSKTYLMNFKQRLNISPPLDINYQKQQIDFIECTKFLGLQIDSRLDWKLHTDTLCNRLYQYSYALYKLSKIANTTALLAAYYGHTASLLRYGIIFWGNSTNTLKVFRAQKRCIRAMFGIRQTDTCKGVFKQWKILTLASLYIFEVAYFVRANLDRFNMFEEGSRHHGTIRHHGCKTALYRKSVFGMAPTIYNKVPKSIRSENNLIAFKNKLNKLLEDKEYYKIDDFLTDKL